MVWIVFFRRLLLSLATWLWVGIVRSGITRSFEGDVHSIRIGNRVNVQDGAVIHATYERFPTTIGNRVSIGHNAIVHGCTIHDNVLIGMGSIVMDDCVVESNSIIAAGAVIPQGTHVPSGTIYGGVPAKKIKDISTELLEDEIERIADNYTMYAGWFTE